MDAFGASLTRTFPCEAWTDQVWKNRGFFFPWQLKLTAILHLNMDRLPAKGKDHLPIIHFQVRKDVSFREGKAISLWHLGWLGWLGEKHLLDDGMVGMDAFIMAGQPTPP